MIAIHASPNIGWHLAGAVRLQQGLLRLGLVAEICNAREQVADVSILLGTTLWKNCEVGDFLLVDRASFKDPEFVSLVWNGHGRRGDHKVPRDRGDRWDRIGCEIEPWRYGDRIVLCGQTETWSPHWATCEEWYASTHATHFRPHPASDNPTDLPTVRNWNGAGRAITLNSSVGVEAAFMGIPVVTMDEGSMAWDVGSHTERPERRPWLDWLAWTQWHWNEIQDGLPIAHLFEDL